VESTKQIKQNRKRLIDTENKLVVARVLRGQGLSKLGEEDLVVQTFSYKISHKDVIYTKGIQSIIL